jgi:hypothetical protein
MPSAIVEDAYRHIAPKVLIAELDNRSRTDGGAAGGVDPDEGSRCPSGSSTERS